MSKQTKSRKLEDCKKKRRYCNVCGELFEYTSKFNYTCEKCRVENHRKGLNKMKSKKCRGVDIRKLKKVEGKSK